MIKTKKTNSLHDEKVFSKRSTKTFKFNTGMVKFANLYVVRHAWTKLTIAAILGLIMSLLTIIFVENTGLYSGGVTAFFQGFARLIFVITNNLKVDPHLSNLIYNLLFWGLYLVFNIPLFIFSWKKIGHHFALMCIIYLTILQVFGFIWGFVPQLDQLLLFGDTTTVDHNLLYNNVQIILFTPNWFPTLNEATGKFDWSNITMNPQSDVIREIITSQNISRSVLLFIYAIVFAGCTSFCYSILYILGGSSAGTDMICIYYSQEKNKALGTVVTTIVTVSMLIGIFMGSYMGSVLTDPNKYSGWQYFFSANLFASLTWAFLNGGLVNKLFPWHNLARVEIYTDKLSEINKYLIENKYTHPTTIVEATGGYSGQSKKILLSICMVIELPKLINLIRDVDQTCLISTSRIVDLDGNMVMQKHAM